MKTVITYGTFNLLHYGYVDIPKRAKSLADDDRLVMSIQPTAVKKIISELKELEKDIL